MLVKLCRRKPSFQLKRTVSSRVPFANLTLPVIQAPMFLVSQPNQVVNSCVNGIVGTFPALNARSTEAFDEWLGEIETRIAQHNQQNVPKAADYGVNLIVHKTNPRLNADLEIVAKHKVPLIITSLGAVPELVKTVHSYGGLVYHDVVNVRHAEKAAEAGVDGLILVCAGAGGHAGTASPFALVKEVRKVFKGTIILSGCISTGEDIFAAQALGADMAYMGTRFIATEENSASKEYKDMICNSKLADILYTAKISGVPANFLIPSLIQCGLDPNNLKDKTDSIDFGVELSPTSKAWKDLWSAGQGCGAIESVLPTAELVKQLKQEYDAARERLCKE
eukprot:TRINITY_DN13604_c0_g1_i1.p1 TRINITY_DN13604_c0_g1~~TRINITY_DN13604_c0_g1_i1.p1  ORF type:complete len:346 (+),score=88.43 TRINITY_DN13604_c0_g1_i1:32-1039(+)